MIGQIGISRKNQNSSPVSFFPTSNFPASQFTLNGDFMAPLAPGIWNPNKNQKVMRKFRIIWNTFIYLKFPSRLSCNCIYVISDINLANCRLTQFKFNFIFCHTGESVGDELPERVADLETWNIKCNGVMNVMQSRSESRGAHADPHTIYVYTLHMHKCTCILYV